jgi:acetyltransferase-like isoleucine patch superfamily enzyme
MIMNFKTLLNRYRRYLSPLVQKMWEMTCDLGILTKEHPRAQLFKYFGEGSLIGFPFGTIYNEKAISIGENTMIAPYTSITAGMAPGQHLISDEIVKIGNRCVIGRGSNIIGHFRIEIEDDVMTGPYVYITDQNHGYEDPDTPVGRQIPVDEPVLIGAGSWLGTGVTVLPGTVIGKNVVVGAGAVVRGVIPDKTVVAGIPARSIKEHKNGIGWVKSPAERPA